MSGRASVIVALVLAAASAPQPAPPGSGTMQATGTNVVVYVAPVAPVAVVRPFHPPVVRYGPGHLGVDLRVGGGSVVRAAGDGVVRFAGPVAGRGVVVVLHPDGISTEYEPVRPTVRSGAAVDQGQPIAVVQGRHTGCAGLCLHWGARRGDEYLDPLTLLRPLGPVVLLPWPRAG
jgi:murein DD-endopeptidase MepM/ murein hydrolase activator NlpD